MATSNDTETQLGDDRNLLQYNDHVVFNYINQWENHSIAKIRQAADDARNDLRQIFDRKMQQFNNILNKIGKDVEIHTIENINIPKWTEQLVKLRDDLSNISKYIHLEHDQDEPPIYLIKLSQKINNQMKPNDDDKEEENIVVPGTEPLTRAKLRIVTIKEQKQMLGERLFLLVQQVEPSLAAKITGMFLELDIKYILALIKSHSILKDKVKEAVEILEAHQYKQRYMKNLTT